MVAKPPTTPLSRLPREYPDQSVIADDAIAAGRPVIKVGVYARISDDPEAKQVGVTDQIKDCIGLANSRRNLWVVYDLYVDNDLTAADWDVIRPEFERLLDDLRTGVIQGVVVLDQDRYVRLPVDLERSIKIYDDRKDDDLVFGSVAGDINLSTDDGVTMARVMVAFANKEVRAIKRRVKRRHKQRAEAGLMVGGNRAFGWNAPPEELAALEAAKLSGDEARIEAAQKIVNHLARRRVDPFEADLIREAAYDILAGTHVYTIAARWNKMGVKTPLGNLWVQHTVRRMLMSGRLVGYRVYKGEIATRVETITDEAGTRDVIVRVRGEQEPILEEPVWEAMCAELARRAALGTRPKAQRYLLSGLLRCGICGKKLIAKFRKDLGYHVYECPIPNNGGGCGKVGVSGPTVEKHVVLLLNAYLDQPSDEDHQVEAWPKEQDVKNLEAKITEMMEAFRNDVLPGSVAFPEIKKIEVEIARLRSEKAEWLRREMVLASRDVPMEYDWENASVAERRVTLSQYLSAIVIHPRGRTHGSVFDPGRIETIWIE